MLTTWQRQGGPLRLVVTGWSMAPLLHPGDTLVVEPPGARLEPGTIVTVRQAGTLLTHRVLAQTQGRLILRGDACRQPDPPLPLHDLVGVVVARERPGRPVLLLREGLLVWLGRRFVGGCPTITGLWALWLRIGWALGLWWCA